MLLRILLIIIGLQQITHAYNVPDVCQGRFEALAINEAQTLSLRCLLFT